MAEQRLHGPRLATAAATLQLQLIREQICRTPYVVFGVDLFLGWLLWRAGLPLWSALWVPTAMLAQFGRMWHGKRLIVPHGMDVARAERILVVWFLVVGLMRMAPVALAVRSGSTETFYLVTIVMVGLAAGGVGTAVGMVKTYAAWALPLALALALGWVSLGSVEGVWVAVLLAMMFAVLTLYVRDYGRALARQAELTESLRIEREATTRFFAAASHDLRQPLGVLRWYGDAVRTHAERLDNEALAKIGDGIGRAVDHAEPLVRTYLEIAQIEAGAVTPTPRDLNAVQLLETVRDAFTREADERGLALRVDCASPSAQLWVHSDESMLRSIVDNLVGNGLKFTRRGGVTMRAERLRGGAGAEQVRIAVVDSGIGIAASEQPRVFDDFYQIANPERSRSKGVGLGLGIARRQAQLLGVELRLRSVQGEGSTFELTLAAAAAPAWQAPAPGGRSATRPGDAPVRRVLVVDDEPEVRLALRLLLEAVGWEVRTASGLRQAVQEWSQGWRPDALVVDHRLQGEATGVQVVRELRASGCAAPAIVVTGDTAPDRLADLARSGLPVLHKPIDGARLVALVDEAVDAAQATTHGAREAA